MTAGGNSSEEDLRAATRRADLLAHLPRRLPLMPLVICGLAALPTLLMLHASLVTALTIPVVFFIVAVFYHRVGTARILNEARQLRDDNAALVHKLSEEKLAAEKARDAAEVSTRAKSVFIANISHEIRTPLNALLGMSQLLERAELERPHRDYVKVMLEAGRGLRTLLDDVIALAREDLKNTRPRIAMRGLPRARWRNCSSRAHGKNNCGSQSRCLPTCRVLRPIRGACGRCCSSLRRTRSNLPNAAAWK